MIVGEHVHIGMIGQTPVVTVPPPFPTPAPAAAPVPAPAPAPAPAPGPVGTQSIPIITLGPTTIFNPSGYAISNIRATVRTPARILTVAEVPGGIFQMTVDRADFDAGLTILFGAPGYEAINVPAGAIACNTGTRNEYGAVTSITSNQCPFKSLTMTPIAAPAPAPAPASTVKKKRSRTQRLIDTASKYGSPLVSARSAKMTDEDAPIYSASQAAPQGMSPLTWALIGGGVILVGLTAMIALRR